jgi:hypothetical protein
MSDTFVFPGLRDRILSGAWTLRVPRMPAPTDVRALATAAVTAAAIAGAMTWMQSAYLPTTRDLTPASALPPAPVPVPAPTASSTIAKTHEQIDALAGLRSDPTLRLDTSSVWLPAGGLGILTARSTPNAHLAALPMPAPIVAARNTPQTETAEAEAEDVPLPRANPTNVATLPERPNDGARTVIATAPEAAVQPTPPSSGGFFGMLERFFTPRDRKTATAMIASNPRTAIYDIDAHVVYMPNGDTLEAHSGLGQWLDDPTSYNRKDRGVTPPNTYKISLREKPFHGVQALRLTPVGEASMYGRDGMLAHTYMLGANGQSNGCVSFKDYEKFLQAYSSGEIEQLIVVPRVTAATAYAQAN